MKAQMFIQTKEEFKESQREIFKELFQKMLPKMMRSVNRKQYLTTNDFKKLTGASHELQKYYRDEGLIPYSQEGRKIWYDADDVDEFMFERKIEAKK